MAARTSPKPSQTDRADIEIRCRERVLDMALLAFGSLVLRLPALLAPAHLTFDDGVFGASAVALREGGEPFTEVFSSQGPLFLALVRLADLLGGETLNAPRLLAVAAGLTTTLAVWAIARRRTDRRGAFVVAVVASTAGSLLWVTGPLAADGPAVAFSALAMLALVRFRASPSSREALLVGLAVGAALSTKLIAVPVLVPVALVLVAEPLRWARPVTATRRALLHLAIAASAAIVVFAVPTLVYGPDDVWDQAVTYHTEAAGGRDPGANVSKILSTVLDRDALLAGLVVVALAASAATAVRGRRPAERKAGSADGLAILIGAWAVAVVALLAYVHPLWRPHLSGLVVPLALLIACARPPRVVLVVALVGLAPIQIANHLRSDDPLYVWPADYSPTSQALHRDLDGLPPGSRVISDDPGHVWRSGRRTPDDLVDTSILRIESERITSESLAAAAGDPAVCAVVVWSEARFGSFADLGRRLDVAGYSLHAEYSGSRRLYTRDHCP